MAVYAGPAKRRRMSAALAAATLVVGLASGVVIGRGTATSLDEQISKGRDGGRDLASALQVLPLEYSQASSGSSETGLIADTVERSVARLSRALDGAPWLSAAQRRQATDAVQAVRAAARDKVPPGRFATIVARATDTLQSVFGLPASTGG